MQCLDSAFLVDLVRGDEGAVRKAASMKAEGVRPSVASVALAEVMLGAHFLGGAYLRRSLEITSVTEILDLDDRAAAEAGRMGAEQLKRGAAVGFADLLIAATAKVNGRVIVSRDGVFTRIPGIAVESY